MNIFVHCQTLLHNESPSPQSPRAKGREGKRRGGERREDGKGKEGGEWEERGRMEGPVKKCEA